MAITINISNKVGFPVKGVVNDESGAEQAFDFTLTANRLSDKALQAVQDELIEEAGKPTGNQLLVDKLAQIIIGWKGVRDESGATISFDTAALGQLCAAYKNLAVMIWHAYNTHVGARAKN